MNLDTVMATICMVVLIIGFCMLKEIGVRRWSLVRRLNIRNKSLSSALRYRSWDAFKESRKRKNLLSAAVQKIQKRRERKMDREIFESITFLRNLASIDKGRTSSTDFVIEQLAEHNGLLRPIYLKMLNLLRLNRQKEAAALFAQKVGTSAARDFASMLIHWDRLEPSELIETLLSYEKNMKAVRLTEQKKKDEILSDLIYFPVVVNILVIFINFIYVAYFIDQKEMLQMYL